MLERISRFGGVFAGVLLVALMAGSFEMARACTTGVVSGRVTPDGRPLLWKNRDTITPDNRVIYSEQGQYAYVGVINANTPIAVWMGVNSAGFAIENSVTRDFPPRAQTGPGNGIFMRIALETCATVEDFEALLERTNGQRRTRANFGVIDAQGGAAIFETGHDTFVKYDANDPQTAPEGYVVRSNFSMAGSGNEMLAAGGDLNEIPSGRRYLRADALFAEAASRGALDHRFLLRHVTRDLSDARGRPFPGSVNRADGALPSQIRTEHTIARHGTVSAAVFHGVRPGEDPLLTTMWVLLGEPTFSLAVPCWVGARGVAPELEGTQESGPLGAAAIELRSAHYTAQDARMLQTSTLPLIWSTVWPVEDAIFDQTEQHLARWRQSRMTPANQIAQFHTLAAGEAMRALTQAREQLQSAGAVGGVAGE